MAKFCPECAHPIIDGNSQFCPKCGERLPIASPELQHPTAQQPGVQQPTHPSYYIPPISASPSSVQTPTPQQSITTEEANKPRSTGEWIAICCGGVILLVVVSAFLVGMASNLPSASASDDKIITQDLSSMAITINDLPTGWTVSKPAAIKNGNFSVNFIRVAGFSANVVYLDIFKYPTVESAKTAYQSGKAKITQYKVESVYLGNEGYGYVDNQASNVVFRKGNIIVKTLYSESSIGGFSSSLSISDSKDYAKIVDGRIQ